jgi:outer membrane protein assembly factor BamB
LSEQETDTRFFETNLVDYELEIGGGQTDEFGSAFFDADMNIGGERDYCQQGACLFALGLRVFFLLKFDQQGDGITFTLLNASGKDLSGNPLNSVSSVGGDAKLSELMGYAGDSRLDEAGTIFLATNADDRGLDPPKIAVEFDTQTNRTDDDPPPDYCADISTANEETRNDPIPFDPPEIDPPAIRDMVQYVFWGRTSFLNIPCRDNNTLYDDNRHDADGEDATEEWRFATGGPVSIGRPAIGPDGTIYMSALDATLYALNEDGSVKWTYTLGAVPGGNNDYMPGVDPVSGIVYSDIAGNKIAAFDPDPDGQDGEVAWDFGIDADFDSTPVVGSDGTIYFGTDITGSGEFFLYALDPAARDARLVFPREWRFPVGGEVDNVPVLSPDGTTVYFVANDNNLYALKRAAREADQDPIGVGPINGLMGEWTYPIDTDPGDINSSPTVNPSDGTIYVGSADNHSAFAINPGGTLKWQFNPGTGRDMRSSPTFAIDPINGIPTVYIGSDDGNLYAIDANTGNDLWAFDTGSPVVSSPVVDLDGTIYVGSDNGNVYAINPNGIQQVAL